MKLISISLLRSWSFTVLLWQILTISSLLEKKINSIQCNSIRLHVPVPVALPRFLYNDMHDLALHVLLQLPPLVSSAMIERIHSIQHSSIPEKGKKKTFPLHACIGVACLPLVEPLVEDAILRLEHDDQIEPPLGEEIAPVMVHHVAAALQNVLQSVTDLQTRA